MKKFLAMTCLVLGVASLARAAGLPFMQNSYSDALSQAQQRKLPIFVECWAPW